MSKTSKIILTVITVLVVALLPLYGKSTAQAATPAPGGDLPGWHQIFSQDFNTTASLGSFLQTYPDMSAYPFPYTDTSRNLRSNPGYYHPEKTLSVQNGVMDAWLHYDATLGKYLVAAPKPKLPTMTYGRFAVRLRADIISGYKIAPLLWPDSEQWPTDGEIDFPEGDLNGSPFSAFHHYAKSSGGQDWFGTTANPTAWHTYEVAWSPSRIEFLVDGVSIGVSTSYVPNKPMHWVLQMETVISATAPATSAQGHVQIDWIKAYSYTGESIVTTPPAPTGLKVVSVGKNSATFAWNPTPLATSYQLRRNGTVVKTTPSTTITDNNLVAGGMYSYTVTASNSTGTSTASSQVTVHLAPAVVKRLIIKAMSNTKAKLSWVKSEGASTYLVYRDGKYRGSTPTVLYKDKGLVHAHKYTYKVYATTGLVTSAEITRSFAT